MDRQTAAALERRIGQLELAFMILFHTGLTLLFLYLGGIL